MCKESREISLSTWKQTLVIRGIPILRNDIASQIIETEAKSLNVQLDESHISNSFRLNQFNKTSAAGYPITHQQQGRIKTRHQPSPIAMRFTDKDKRNGIFRRKKLLNGNNEIKSVFLSKNVVIREDLTEKRKTLFETANVAANSKA